MLGLGLGLLSLEAQVLSLGLALSGLGLDGLDLVPRGLIDITDRRVLYRFNRSIK